MKGKTSTHLMAFQPLLDETNMTAENHLDLFISMLELYGKSVENVLFIVGDNASVNMSLAEKMGVPFIGCASHRLNLAVNQILKSEVPI